MPKERIPSPGGMNLLARLISRIKSSLGIVEETNTATHTIAAGKYVTWKGNVCRAKSAIPAGTALSSSNLEALSDGGLNDLSDALNSKLSTVVYTQTIKYPTSYIKYYKSGNVVTALIRIDDAETKLPSTGILLESGYRPTGFIFFTGKANVNDADIIGLFSIDEQGYLHARNIVSNATIEASWVRASVTYVVNG